MRALEFYDYEAAREFARELGMRGVSHSMKRTTSGWLVEYRQEAPAEVENFQDLDCDDPHSSLEVRSLQQGLADQQRVILSARQRIANQDIQIEKLNAENGSTREENTRLTNDIADCREKIATQDTKIRQFMAEYGPIREEIARLRNEIIAYKDKIANQDAQIKSLMTETKLKQIENVGLSSDLLDAQRKVGLLEFALDKFKRTLEKAEQRFGKMTLQEMQVGASTSTCCPQCGGDGGLSGRCPRCAGTGSIERTQTKEVLVVAPPSTPG